MNDRRSHVFDLRIDAAHPALPGHFPGRPIVPGVVLLDRVIAAAEQWLRCKVSPRSLPQAKFNAPLLPGESAQGRLSLEGEELRFEILRGGTTIASGLFRVTAGPVS
jgi:3-hydroxymyristoyl/3-hydroxydecanoyl-(acyl carrier protein) dehydratase